MVTSPAKKGLGKGLSALMNDAAPALSEIDEPIQASLRNGLRVLPVASLQAGKYQPRRQFNDEALQELADSIEKNGVIQPILARALPDGMFEIVAGERRFRAAKLAKLEHVPVLVRSIHDGEALEMALVENIQRADLNPLEEAAGYQRLMDEFRYTQEKLAAVVGKSRSHVANLLRLLDLPEAIKTLLDAGKLTMGHARALLNAPNPETLARQIIAEGLNVRQAEALVNGEGLKGKTATPAAEPRARAEAPKTDEVREIETMLAENLGLKVSLERRSGKSGEVVISYETLSQLDEILRRLSGTMY